MPRLMPLLLGLILAAYQQTTRAEAPAVSYSFGIGPAQSAIELAKRWTPVMQYLSEKSGVHLQFKTAKDIPAYQQQVRQGAYDFIYIIPYYYLLEHKNSGYIAFAREKEGKLFGVLVVKKDSTIQDVSQLNRLTLAFPSASALAATWLPLNMLRDKGVQVTPQYVNSLDSVYRSVAKGLFVAGGGELRTLGTTDPEIKNQLRVLWTSEGLPPFTFAAHPRVPKDVLAKVQKAMDEMDQNPQGLALLRANNFKGMEITDDADYNDMRKLNIKPVEAK